MAAPGRPLRNMADKFGFFDFDPVSDHSLAPLIEKLVTVATETVGEIDGVVLPELSITEDVYEQVSEASLKETKFLVCGVKAKGTAPFSANQVRFRMKLWSDMTEGVVGELLPQNKHHRWLLEESQIVQYGLGGSITPTVKWWENIEVGRRDLNFVVLEDWLTTCVLICEDLARQDPVADTVRAIGPNLVIALLMDGPQLASRWAARYATVLADDPGSSVLTLTSLGMAQLSRPAGKEPLRVIGLWKDAMRADPVEIRLPEKHQAVVLSMSVKEIEEYTADGRSDRGKTGVPTLSGLHPIRVN